MNTTDGIGSTAWWGFSSCLDLQNESDISSSLKELDLSEKDGEELNILIVGAADGRHIFQTMASSYKHRKKKITFYVLEHSLELYARQMLLLTITLEPPEVVGLQEKTHLFMEIYGNALIRSNTHKYLRAKAEQLLLMVTDFYYMNRRMPLFNLNSLKYKEIDTLESIFKFWRLSGEKEFDIQKHWDTRLRCYLGARYDSRLAAYDWDYHMKLCEKDADIINPFEYKKWRESGIAFEVFETAENKFPNLTLVSGIILRRNGLSYFHRGYCGDIVTGPFITYGIECDKKSYFKKCNNRYVKMSKDITEHNVMTMMYELLHKSKFIPQEAHEQQGCQIRELSVAEIKSSQERASVDSEPKNQDWKPEEKLTRKKVQEEKYEPIITQDTQIVFLPLTSLVDMPRKEKFRSKFHVAFFGTSMVHNFKPEIQEVLMDGALVLLETAKFILDLRPESTKEFSEKIKAMAQDAGCEPLSPITEKDAVGKFIHKKSTQNN